MLRMFTQRQVAALTALTAIAWCAAPSGVVGADAPPATPKAEREMRRQFGTIRIIGPDGRVHERHFGGSAPFNAEEFAAKLKELQAAAGDREAVERISQELLQMATGGTDLEAAARPMFGLGISLAAELPAALRAQLKLDADSGVLVQSVAKESPAEKAGLREHDLILAVDGRPLSKAKQLVDAVQAAGEKQQAVSLAVISAGEHKTIEATPAASKEIAWEVSRFDSGAAPLVGGPGAGAPNWAMGQPPHITLWAPPGFATSGNALPHLRVHPLQGDPKLAERVEKLEQEVQKLREQLERSAQPSSDN